MIESRLVVWLTLATVVASGTAPVNVRLIDHNVPSVYQGRVEIFYEGLNNRNEFVSGWFTVCDDYWDYREAKVVCRQLGFSSYDDVYYSSYFGAGSAPIAMDQLFCTGRESSLHECDFDGWFKHDCKKTEHAGVRCRVTNPASRVTLPVRLTQGANNNEGIVEIQYQGRWGAIEKYNFGYQHARVVCGQLGYPNGEARSCAADLDECAVYKGWTIAKGFICSGQESTLSMCKLMFWFKDDGDRQTYNTSDLAYVRCSVPPRTATPSETPSRDKCDSLIERGEILHETRFYNLPAVVAVGPTLRLRGGTGPWEGRVEIFNTQSWNAGAWSPLCHRGWDKRDGNVVCRQLGYGTAKNIYTSSRFGRGVGYNYNRILECHGNESALSECPDKDIGWHGCRHWEEAGVECYRPAKASDRVRLVDIRRIYQGRNGFVEVMHGPCDEWHRVCDQGWSLSQARVVCRDLGLGFGKFGRLKPDGKKATKASITVNYHCTGEEVALSDCDSDVHNVVSEVHGCDATMPNASQAETEPTPRDDSANTLEEPSPCESGFAWVECMNVLPDLVADVSHLRRSLASYPYIVNTGSLPCAYEEGCFAKSAILYNNSYQYDDRTLLRFATRVMNLGRAPFQPHTPPHKWIWHSCHKHYHSFEAFSIYHVVDMCGKQMAQGHKASFCLEDSDCEERGPVPRAYYNCRGANGGRQGISVNCADTYRQHIDCQWVDITGLPYNRYRLVIDINPHRRVAETDFSNNVMFCNFRYYGKWSSISVEECGFDPDWKSDDYN